MVHGVLHSVVDCAFVEVWDALVECATLHGARHGSVAPNGTACSTSPRQCYTGTAYGQLVAPASAT